MFTDLLTLAVLAAIVVLFNRLRGLKQRVDLLERQLADGRDPRPVAQAAALAGTDPDGPPLPVPPADLVPEAETAAGPLVSGPWNRPAPAMAPVLPDQNRPIVLRADRLAQLAGWLQANWVYAISALSLALAGIFFVQYGVERGLLPPPVRVLMALLFGAVLIGAGEWLRRRYGDGEDSATAYLPSTFSGAGLVSIFGGILAARQLYGLIGPEMAFAGLVLTAGLAIVLGWFNGPFLAAIGLIGAAAAPLVTGGDSEAPYWLYGYYAGLAGAGLAVDALRRWAWVSVLALVLGYGGGWLVMAGTGGVGWWAMHLVALALLAIAVPLMRLGPLHDGPTVAGALMARGKAGWPSFPVRLAAGAVLASTLGLTLPAGGTAADSAMGFFALAALGLALTLWAARAPALSDLVVLPVAGFLARLVLEGADRLPLAAEFQRQAIALRPPETSGPMTASALLGLGVALTLAAAWRSQRGSGPAVFWAMVAALTAPVAAVALELFWQPAAVNGAYPWALQVIALAALMTGIALTFARHDGEERRRAAYAVLSALSLIALALFLVTTKAALTVALAVLIAVAAALDRRFRLPEMGWFIQAGVAVLGFRLVADPGLGWAVGLARPWEVIASYGGAVAAAAAGLWLLTGLERPTARAVLDSALAAFAALLANALLLRWLTGGPAATTGPDWASSYWGVSLNALPWLIVALTQLYRLKLGGALRWVRIAVAAVAGLMALVAMAVAVLPLSPMVGFFQTQALSLVYGLPVFDTLLLAYAVPGALILAALTRLGHLPRLLQVLLALPGTALLALYLVLEIRRFWRGDDLSVPGITQPELYTYTVAMMLLGAGLLYQAIARRSQGLRRIAMAVIALTVAKVFLVDASELTGLIRVVSFLALGLSLAGLAWLNRWAAGRQAG